MTDYTQNPFASTHSLDTNPFDDPSSQRSAGAVSPNAAARLEEIRRREADLERREADLITGLITFGNTGGITSPHTPHHTLIQLWLVLFGTLIVNFIAALIILISGFEGGGADLGGSLGSCLIHVSVHCASGTSFMLVCRPIYNGYMKVKSSFSITQEQALYYYFYFFFCGFHLLFSLYMIIGFPGTGSVGFVQTIRLFTSHHWVAAVFSLIATIGWTVQGVGNAYYYRQIYQHHTAAGHTMEKAKTELASHGAKAYFTRG
ncbi:scamp family-domain-containing protein [Pholiota molesta]|nr:scamp family-domain-containing protein [Pholiota molesta]